MLILKFYFWWNLKFFKLFYIENNLSELVSFIVLVVFYVLLDIMRSLLFK